MAGHTPQFDALLEEHFSSQTAGQRRCSETGADFSVTEEEVSLYKKLGLPVPTVAPHIRRRRTRAHIGGIELFPRKTMQGQDIIAMYDPESPAQLVTPDEWYSDGFDPTRFAMDIDPNQSFFEQWKRFSAHVPRVAISTDPSSEQCSWSVYELAFKNCYATYGGIRSENLLFADMCIEASNSVDVAGIIFSSWCYDSVQLVECSNTHFSEFCTGCLNTTFCMSCINCTDCFGCVNLQNKQYCFFNKQLTKEEYEAAMAQIDLSDATQLRYWQEKVREYWKHGFYIGEFTLNSEHAYGFDVIGSNDAYGISMNKCTRAYNIYDAELLTDCCDVSTSSKLEECAHTVAVVASNKTKMSISCEGCIDVEYSEGCRSCEHCFGCIGLSRKKFCIFNKQYTEEEYWKTVDAIKSTMMRLGEYGNFFPYNTSLFAYNVSHADAFFPLEQSEVERIGARWFPFQKANTSTAVPIDQLPEKLSEFTDDMLTKQFICPETGRPFRIIQPELNFHRKFNLALPRVHPSVRRKMRYKRLMELRLIPQPCRRCGAVVHARLPESSGVQFLCPTCFHTTLVNSDMVRS